MSLQDDSLAFHVCRCTIDPILTNQPFVPPRLLPIQEAFSLGRFDQMQIIRAVHAYQHDGANCECAWIARHERDKIAVINFATHRVAARSDLHGFATS